MFKKFVAITLAALVIASVVTGCGEDTEVTKSADIIYEHDYSLPSPIKFLNPPKPSANVDFGDYAVPRFWGEDSGFEGVAAYDFDLEGYLMAYGAREVQLLKSDLQEAIYGVKFQNGIILGLYFSCKPESAGVGCVLTEVVVTAGTPDYPIISYDTLKNAATRKWSETFNFYGNHGAIRKAYCTEEFIENNSPYLLNFNNNTSFYSDANALLYVQLDFDDVFKKTVAPYVTAKRISLEKDPLENK